MSDILFGYYILLIRKLLISEVMQTEIIICFILNSKKFKLLIFISNSQKLYI